MAMLLGACGSARALCVPVACSCAVATTNVAFGTYNPLAFGNTDTSASLKVTCGGVAGLLIPFDIALSAGGSGSATSRRLSSGARTLTYNLYADAAYTTVWGDGTTAPVVSASVLLDVLGLAPAQQFWVYGRIPGRQLTAVPGVYADAINVTVTYY